MSMAEQILQIDYCEVIIFSAGLSLVEVVHHSYALSLSDSVILTLSGGPASWVNPICPARQSHCVIVGQRSAVFLQQMWN